MIFFKERRSFLSKDKDAGAKASAVPSARQLAHTETPFYAFFHFGMNTFTDREWGTGTEDPELFTLEKLDTDQWIESIMSAGMGGAIITAKHHDGFALWPSNLAPFSVKNTPFSVKNTPYRGNVVLELYRSCKKYGVKFGFYISPWDMNFLKKNTNPTSEAYNNFYIGQLEEIDAFLRREPGYSPSDVFEVWFDGAVADEFKGKIFYDWERITNTVRALFPDACTAISPPDRDVSWVGNEHGYAGKNDVSFSRTCFENKENYWYYSKNECDVSIRNGWFYHENESVKSLSELVDIYYNSVGKNCTLLLNVPPDKNGRIAEADVMRLKELGGAIDEITTGKRYQNPAPIEFSKDKYYFDCTFLGPTKVSHVIMSENFDTDGERVEKIALFARVKGKWKRFYKGKSVGSKTIVKTNLTTTAVRVAVLRSREESVTINKIEIY